MQYSDFHRIVIAFILAAARVGGALAICPATSSSMITGAAITTVVRSMPSSEPRICAGASVAKAGRGAPAASAWNTGQIE